MGLAKLQEGKSALAKFIFKFQGTHSFAKAEMASQTWGLIHQEQCKNKRYKEL
jgi:hypothetical protein